MRQYKEQPQNDATRGPNGFNPSETSRQLNLREQPPNLLTLAPQIF